MPIKTHLIKSKTAHPSLLFHFDGENNDVTTTSVSAVGGQAISFSGNAIISTSDSKFGESSAYFDGSSSTKISIIENNNFTNFACSDFTIEAWIKIDETSCNQDGPCIVEIGSHAGFNSDGIIFMTGYRNNNWIIWGWIGVDGANGALPYTDNYITPGVWTHVAMARSNNAFRIFINGIKGSEDTRLSDIVGTDSVIHMGGSYNDAIANQFGGYIDEVRIIKGKALYTSNFTPPTSPFNL